MATTKLSITVRAALEKKYPAKALARLDKAIAAWVKADAARGIQTLHVAVDSPADMAPFGVKALKKRMTSNKIKRALDALVAATAPEYVVIVGAGDVVPHFLVPNPSYSAGGDDDELVPTDNPYACSAKFRRSARATYLVPDRVLGRIPDLPGSSDPAWLVDYLTHAAAWHGRPSSAYTKSPLAVCCATWRGSGVKCVKELGAAPGTLQVTPPADKLTPAVKSRHKSRTHLIKCHGQEQDSRFYGEGGGRFPEVVTSAAIAGRITEGTVVGAMCCYGATVFDPDAPTALTPGVPPVPAVYLKQGAHGFLGSTTLAWVGDIDMLCADWVVTSFLQRATTGASLGRAALEAKQDLLRWLQQQGAAPDGADEKTLLQFMLLGDPSIHPALPAPVIGAPKPAAARPVAATMRAMVAGSAGRQARRVMRFELGRVLRAGLLDRRVLTTAVAKAPAAAVAAVAAAMLERLNARNPHAFAQAPTSAEHLSARGARARPGPVAAGLGARMAVGVAPSAPSVFQYSWSVRLGTKGPRRVGLVTVNADAEGRVIGQRMVLSS